MIKYLLCSFFLLSACTSDKENPHYIIEYGPQKVSEAEFIKSLMTSGFILYGENLFSYINDPKIFDSLKTRTLENILENIYIEELAKKEKLTITEEELTAWIDSRSHKMSEEDLKKLLKANNLTLRDWKNIFKSQLLKSKVLTALQPKESSPDSGESKKSSEKKSSDPALLLGVLTFESQLQADTAYQALARQPSLFDSYSEKQSLKTTYSWVKTRDLPFYSKIQNLGLGSISKPFDSDWGLLIVRIKQRGSYPLSSDDTKGQQQPLSLPPSYITNFKNDPKLKINMDRVHSLNLKR